MMLPAILFVTVMLLVLAPNGGATSQWESLSRKAEKMSRGNEEVERLFHPEIKRDLNIETLKRDSRGGPAVERDHELAIVDFIKSQEGKDLIKRLKEEFPEEEVKLQEGMILFLTTTRPNVISAPGYADVLYKQMKKFLKEDDTDTREHESDEKEGEEKPEKEEDEEEDTVDEEGEHDVAILDSPQWRAMMVLTATNAEVNDPAFIEKWMNKRSSTLLEDRSMKRRYSDLKRAIH